MGLLTILRANPVLFGLGAALFVSAFGWGVQTWRIGNLQERIGASAAALDQCDRVNQANVAEYRQILSRLLENAKKRQGILERQAKELAKLKQIEAEREARADEDIEAIQADTSDCADTAIPDAIRVRLAQSHNGG